jgi:hypothetical protein
MFNGTIVPVNTSGEWTRPRISLSGNATARPREQKAVGRDDQFPLRIYYDSLLRAPRVPRHARHRPDDAEHHGELHAFALDRSEVPAPETQRVPQSEPHGHAHQNDDRVQDFPLRFPSGRDGERRAQNQGYQPDYGHEHLSLMGRARDIWSNTRLPTRTLGRNRVRGSNRTRPSGHSGAEIGKVPLRSFIASSCRSN